MIHWLQPRPSVAIVKFWQGILEIALRGTAIGVAFIIFICAAVLADHTKGSVFNDVPENATDIEGARKFTHHTANWIIFTAWMSMLWETVAIILRFLNLSIVNRYIESILKVDIVFKVVFVLSWFIGVVIFEVIGTHSWNFDMDLYPSVPFTIIKSSSNTTAFFCIVDLVLHVALAVWIGVWLFAKWQENVTRILRVTARKKLCFLCNSPVDGKFDPCGHSLMCAKCGDKAKHCPICKKSVTNITKLEQTCPMCNEEKVSVTVKPCGHEFCPGCVRRMKVCFECKTEISSKEGLSAEAPDENTCAICLNKPINTAFNCGHQSCNDCAQQVNNCHVCRQRIIQKIRLFS